MKYEDLPLDEFDEYDVCEIETERDGMLQFFIHDEDGINAALSRDDVEVVRIVFLSVRGARTIFQT